MCSAYHNYTRLHFTIFNDARCFLPDNMVLLEFKMFMGERSDAFLHATNGNSRNGKNVFFVPVTISSRIVFKCLNLLTYATNFPNFCRDVTKRLIRSILKDGIISILGLLQLTLIFTSWPLFHFHAIWLNFIRNYLLNTLIERIQRFD